MNLALIWLAIVYYLAVAFVIFVFCMKHPERENFTGALTAAILLGIFLNFVRLPWPNVVLWFTPMLALGSFMAAPAIAAVPYTIRQRRTAAFRKKTIRRREVKPPRPCPRRVPIHEQLKGLASYRLVRLTPINRK